MRETSVISFLALEFQVRNQSDAGDITREAIIPTEGGGHITRISLETSARPPRWNHGSATAYVGMRITLTVGTFLSTYTQPDTIPAS